MDDPLDRFLTEPAGVHFLGIGGVGMAGLALLLHARGYRISGSDAAASPLTSRLQARGITVFTGHHRHQIPADLDWAVRTPAVSGDNPELEALRGRQIPVFARGNVLAAYSRGRRTLAVAGAHGKTTTSAMLTHLLRAAGVDCAYAIGGETVFPGCVADAGSDPLFVCEADESDGTLVHYAPEVGILTHVEWDHVERFGTEAALLECYRRFARRCGTVIYHADDALARRAAAGHPRQIALGPQTHLLHTADDPDGQEMELVWKGETLRTRICLPGRHNARNALLAFAAAQQVRADSDPAGVWDSLRGFVSVGRRFERSRAGGVEVIHDYAHHPTEIRALLESVRALRPRRIVAAFQPHRYSRTRHLLRPFAEAFAGVDRLHLLPVYAASKLRSQKQRSEALAGVCRELLGGERVELHADAGTLAARAAKELAAGDVFLIVGAGDILTLADMIHTHLQAKGGQA